MKMTKTRESNKKEETTKSKNSTCAFKKHAHNLINVYDLDIN